MKRILVFAVLAVGLVCLQTGDAAAQCGAGAKTECGASAQPKAACPVPAALAKVKLTAEQQKVVDQAMAKCRAGMKDAESCGCPNAKAEAQTKAVAGCREAILAVLTPEQKAVVEPALAACKPGTCGDKGCCAK